MRLARAHARLGWHWWPSPERDPLGAYDGRRPCVRRGTCTSGCNEGAKASTDLTHWPHVVAGGGTVITGARVRRLVADGRGLVYGAEWLDSDGRRASQHGRRRAVRGERHRYGAPAAASATECIPTVWRTRQASSDGG